MMEFRVLGPLTVLHDDRERHLGGPRQRAVLAALLLRANESVTAERLVPLVWDDPVPAAESNLRTYLTRLRKTLADPRDGDSRLTRDGDGYRLTVHDGECDRDVFTDLAEHGDRAFHDGDHATAADRYRRALALFRGEPFGGAAAESALSAAAVALTERHRTVLERRMEAGLALGEHRELLGDLRRLAERSPEREASTRLLMLALHRDGRREEALAAYAAHRARLVAELGVEPGTGLSALHARILAGDPSLAARPPASSGPVTSFRQLPPDIADFTGREDELARIAEAAGAAADGPAVVCLSGMGGVGKTRLAVRAAWSLAASYPDGQLFTDLRGYDPELPPADPAAVLAGFLGLLGVGRAEIPRGLDARARLFSERLDGRRVLLVLDNAADEAAVRPLLPTATGCLVLVTGRRELELGGVAVPVGMFSRAEALSLLGRILGERRVDDEADAAGELVGHCGRLPLAVAVAAHRLRTRRTWRMADLVERLGGRGLGELAVGDRSVERVLALSYEALPERERRVLRLVGAQPVEDATAASAAALCGLDVATAGAILRSLAGEHLLGEFTPGRYRPHDLVRAHMAALSAAHDPPGERAEAAGRLLDWYSRAAYEIAGRMALYPVRLVGPLPETPVPIPDTPTFAEGAAWFDAEYADLFGLIRFAAATGRTRHAVQLPFLMRVHFSNRALADDWTAAMMVAVEAARELGDLVAEGHAHTLLGLVNSSAGRLRASREHVTTALALHRRAGEVEGEAGATMALGHLDRAEGRYREAIAHYERSRELFAGLGDRQWEIASSGAAGEALHQMGRTDEAIEVLRTAATLQGELGQGGEASTLTNLGAALRSAGRGAEAVPYLERALGVFRERGVRRGEAEALTQLAKCRADLGDPREAAAHARRALEIARGLSDRAREAEAAQILERLGQPTTPA
ncbi:BTAD domain-containing putative transcriptional regulator [Phytomonospora sp. NPDC050363]|uniref:AfsR/SARP family transcriptional regulator n=1 Tax=Phytomonospora sp. NPDC050363 TaxID=3155642 RepID=UPI0033E1397C